MQRNAPRQQQGTGGADLLNYRTSSRCLSNQPAAVTKVLLPLPLTQVQESVVGADSAVAVFAW